MTLKHPLEEMGRWLKAQEIIQRERTDAEMIALALFLIHQGAQHSPGGPGSKAAEGGGQPCSRLELGA